MIKRVAISAILMLLAGATGYVAVYYLLPLASPEIGSNSFPAPNSAGVSGSKDDKAYYVRRNEHGSALVPGGVYNQATLIEHAKLYPMCDLSNAYFGTLPSPMLSRVSYMQDGHMYWTRKPRLLPAGEFVIYAGSCLILQRCGNLLDTQQLNPQPTMQIEPLDIYPPEQPIIPVPVPFMPAAPARGPQPEEHTSTAPTVPPSTYIGQPAALFVPGPGVPSKIVDTPEPSTIVMVFLGVLILAPMFLRSWIK